MWEEEAAETKATEPRLRRIACPIARDQPARLERSLRQYLYFCTSKASKLRKTDFSPERSAAGHVTDTTRDSRVSAPQL